MQLHFQAQGHGTPLIILHGFLGSLDNWKAVSPRLSSRFTVFTLDLRNHGLSPHDETINYDVMSHDVFEFLEQHSLPSVHIAGHSMGGKVAMQFATDHTERVDKLIVVDMAPRTYEPLQRPVLDALRSIDLSVHKSFGEVDAALMTAIPETAMRRFLLKNLMREEGLAFGGKSISRQLAETMMGWLRPLPHGENSKNPPVSSALAAPITLRMMTSD